MGRQPLSFAQALAAFLQTLEGRNLSPATARAYQTDLGQFISWLPTNTILAQTPAQVTKGDISEYLAALGRREVSGVSRARKLSALREFFRFLVDHDYLSKSPTAGVATPKKERNGRTWLRPDEYTKMLALAGASARDFAMLQVFLQSGARVSELCDLRLDDVDFIGRKLRVCGKGRVVREIDLEPKGMLAIRRWLDVRPESPYDHLFLNYLGEPISARGVRKIVVGYRQRAGITKPASCHSLRHTFATYKAGKGVSPYQLQEWLGHKKLDTTQIYVHLGKAANAKRLMEATSL